MSMVQIAQGLSKSLAPLKFAEPVTHVYDPVIYAWQPHKAYLERYGSGPKEALLLGMNPGPWGMAQTGVPFGEVAHTRDWLGIDGKVNKPRPEHPKRPIEGFDCQRSEVSGARLWGWAKQAFGTPERFFARFFVYNYCPLVFMEEGGKNRTPDKLPVAERDPLLELCDQALVEVVKTLEVPLVIGVGAFAEARLKKALKGQDIRIGRILHPSPASPIANRGWAERADLDFKKLNVAIP